MRKFSLLFCFVSLVFLLVVQAGATGYVVGPQVNGQIVNANKMADDCVGDIDSDGDAEIVSWFTLTAGAQAGSLMVHNALAGSRDTAIVFSTPPLKIVFADFDSVAVTGGLIDGANGLHFDDEILVIFNNHYRVISYLQ